MCRLRPFISMLCKWAPNTLLLAMVLSNWSYRWHRENCILLLKSSNNFYLIGIWCNAELILSAVTPCSVLSRKHICMKCPMTWARFLCTFKMSSAIADTHLKCCGIKGNYTNQFLAKSFLFSVFTFLSFLPVREKDPMHFKFYVFQDNVL